MTQSDGQAANQSPASFRADVNLIFESILTLNSGASAPSVTYENQFWVDTTNGLLKQRDTTDTSWVTLGTLNNPALIRMYAGSPAGNITGNYVGELCFDTVNKEYYFATSASTSTWESFLKKSTSLGYVDQQGNALDSGDVIFAGKSNITLTSAGFGGSGNKLYLSPYEAQGDITISGLSFYVSAYNSTPTLYVVVYASDGLNGFPSTRLAVSSGTNIAANGQKNLMFTSNLSLKKKELYWLGLSFGGVGVINMFSSNTMSGFLSEHSFTIAIGTANIDSSDGYYTGPLYKDSVTGLPPNPLGGTTGRTNAVPAVWLIKA